MYCAPLRRLPGRAIKRLDACRKPIPWRGRLYSAWSPLFTQFDQAEPLDPDRFGVAQCPVRVTGVAPDELGDLGPVRDMATAPVGRVYKVLALIARNIVAPQVQQSDPDAGGFHDPAA